MAWEGRLCKVGLQRPFCTKEHLPVLFEWPRSELEQWHNSLIKLFKYSFLKYKMCYIRKIHFIKFSSWSCYMQDPFLVSFLSIVYFLHFQGKESLKRGGMRHWSQAARHPPATKSSVRSEILLWWCRTDVSREEGVCRRRGSRGKRWPWQPVCFGIFSVACYKSGEEGDHIYKLVVNKYPIVGGVELERLYLLLSYQDALNSFSFIIVV